MDTNKIINTLVWAAGLGLAAYAIGKGWKYANKKTTSAPEGNEPKSGCNGCGGGYSATGAGSTTVAAGDNYVNSKECASRGKCWEWTTNGQCWPIKGCKDGSTTIGTIASKVSNKLGSLSNVTAVNKAGISSVKTLNGNF